MDKYIHADTLKNILEKERLLNDFTGVLDHKTVEECIDDMPSADVVEVVRCKDCVNSVCIPRNIGEEWFCDIKYNEWGEPWATSPGGFCDCGERRETE